MSLSREALLEIMALADGELDGEAKDRVERLAQSSEEAGRAVAAMRAPALRVWLTETMDRRTTAADGIADAVMSRLAPPVGGAAERSSRRRARTLGLRLGGGAVGVAMALAAGVALYVSSAARAPDGAPVARVAVPSAEIASSPGPQTAESERVAPVRGVVVDEIDSPSRDVSIFQIPTLANASASSSVVVWIDDEPGTR